MYKKTKILDAALLLFGENGIHATTTKSIAIQAGTSEGLIFKHFTDKKTLLVAVIEREEKRIHRTLNELESIEIPIKRLEAILEWPKNNYQTFNNFWNLYFSLRYGHHQLMPSFHQSSVFQHFIEVTETSLRQMGFPNPGTEALTIWLTTTGYFVHADSLYPTQITSLLRHYQELYQKVFTHLHATHII